VCPLLIWIENPSPSAPLSYLTEKRKEKKEKEKKEKREAGGGRNSRDCFALKNFSFTIQ
jgi:hypothetical protein